MIKKIKELERVLLPADAGSSLDIRAWLDELPEETWVGGEGPRDGRLHVADVLAGGHSGRPHTFIIGLDDGRFPGSGVQDPILLDDERRRLSPELPTAGHQLAKRLDRFARLLARLRGTVTLSYSCYNLADDREMFPELDRAVGLSNPLRRARRRPRCLEPLARSGRIIRAGGRPRKRSPRASGGSGE